MGSQCGTVGRLLGATIASHCEHVQKEVEELKFSFQTMTTKIRSVVSVML